MAGKRAGGGHGGASRDTQGATAPADSRNDPEDEEAQSAPARRQQDLHLGQSARAQAYLLLNKLTLVREVGQGVQATVYELEGPDQDFLSRTRRYAAKISKPEDFEQALAEQDIVSGLPQHPHIVQVFDSWVGDSTVLLLMEFAEENLKQFWGARHVPGEILGFEFHDQAISMVAQVLSALAHLHEQGIVHRDIKPENILLFPEGTVKIADFGLAIESFGKRMEPDGTGSDGYKAPEDEIMKIGWTQNVDVWSLGLRLSTIVYETMREAVDEYLCELLVFRVHGMDHIFDLSEKLLERDSYLRMDAKDFDRIVPVPGNKMTHRWQEIIQREWHRLGLTGQSEEQDIKHDNDNQFFMTLSQVLDPPGFNAVVGLKGFRVLSIRRKCLQFFPERTYEEIVSSLDSIKRYIGGRGDPKLMGIFEPSESDSIFCQGKSVVRKSGLFGKDIKPLSSMRQDKERFQAVKMACQQEEEEFQHNQLKQVLSKMVVQQAMRMMNVEKLGNPHCHIILSSPIGQLLGLPAKIDKKSAEYNQVLQKLKNDTRNNGKGSLGVAKRGEGKCFRKYDAKIKYILQGLKENLASAN